MPGTGSGVKVGAGVKVGIGVKGTISPTPGPGVACWDEGGFEVQEAMTRARVAQPTRAIRGEESLMPQAVR